MKTVANTSMAMSQSDIAYLIDIVDREIGTLASEMQSDLLNGHPDRAREDARQRQRCVAIRAHLNSYLDHPHAD